MPQEALRILLPLDGSPESESILTAILPMAARRPLRLTLLGAIAKEEPCGATEASLERAREAARGTGIDIRVETCLGDPSEAIVAHAISERTDLIAMTTHGRSGLKRLLMGSVTERVLRHAPVPLLTCRPGSRMEGSTHVVALDGSLRAESILDDVVPITRLMGATLHLLHIESMVVAVVHGSRGAGGSGGAVGSYLQRVSTRLESQGVSVRIAVRTGAAGDGILRYATEAGASLVAMATHGRSGLGRVLMGSVAEEVLRKGGFPMLLRRELRRSSPPRPPGIRMIRPASI